MDVILRAKNGFEGRIIDVLVEDDGRILIQLESETDMDWFDGSDLEPCDHAIIKKEV